MKYFFTYDLRRTDDILIAKAEELLQNALNEIAHEFQPDEVVRLRERIHQTLLGDNVERYDHQELRNRIRDLIVARGWTLHEVSLYTSFLFESDQDLTIEQLQQIFTEGNILGERIFTTDNYLFTKITANEHYLLNN